MSTQKITEGELDDMARTLSSMYEEGATTEDSEGAIYSELKRSGDRYTDAELLAHGGMKKVSRIFDTKTGRQVAMAELRSNAPPELYEPFLREARLTSLLEHPNIISVHDMGLSPDGRPFFTMDLKRGDSLADILKKKKMQQEQLLEIYIKLCDAISYAHSQKVLHLDLKPDNIQIGCFGEVFICDWGLGKVVGSDESEEKEFDEFLLNPDLLNNMTLSGELKGTPGYMAPEQFEKGGEKTFKTDVYALGCLLYTILTQQPPLIGTPEEIRELTLTGNVVPPALAFPNKSIPQGLNAVTMKALALKPADRYASVMVLRNDVKNYLSGFSTSAENAGFTKEFSLFFKRNRAACLVGLNALLVVVVTTGLFILKLQNSLGETRSAHQLAEAQRQETAIQRQEAEMQRLEAVALRREADARRKEAEEAIERYHEEQRRNMSLLGSLAGNLEFEATELSRILIYSDPVRALELSIQRYKFLQSKEKKFHPEYSSQIGYCYFVMQDFATANKYYGPGAKGGQHGDLAKLSRKYKKLKEGKLLSIDQLANLISECKWRPLLEKMLLCDYEMRKDKVGYELAVRAVLVGWNNEWTHGRFEYDPQQGSLLLRGKNLKEFAMFSLENSGESPLRFLDIKFLDARDTGLHDLNQIKTLTVQSLNIRGTKVSDLKPIRQFPTLHTLIIARGQFSAEQLAGLPKTLSVLIRD